jgi:hypothetical protein
VYWQAKGQALAKEAVAENKALRLERDRLLHQIKALHALIAARDASVKAHADLVTSGTKASSKASASSEDSSKVATRASRPMPTSSLALHRLLLAFRLAVLL